MDQKRFLGLMDMIDGGGMGRAGQTFEGGPLSGFLNALGVRPAGYMDRLEDARPMARPANLGAPMAPSDGSVQNMSDEELIALVNEALGRANNNSVYAPGAITTTPLMSPMSPNRFAPSYFGMGPR